MKRIAISILLLYLSFSNIFSQIDSRLEYVSIDYPTELEIPDDFNKNMISTIKINFKYFGEEISANNGNIGEYTFSRMNFFSGDIRYLKKDGTVLGSALKYFKKYGFDAFQRHEIGTSSYGMFTLFKNGQIISSEITILSSSLFDNAGLYESLMNRDLSTIEITINDVRVKWELKDFFKNEKHVVREGQFIVKINKTIKIMLLYQRDSGKCEKKIKSKNEG